MTTQTQKVTQLRWLKLSQIRIGDLQPRKHFPAKGHEELRQSLRQHGFKPGLGVLLVRPIGEVKVEHEPDSKHWFLKSRKSEGTNGEWETVGTADSEEEAKEKALDAELFELIAGERRYRAATEENLERAPADIEEMDDLHVLEHQLVENLQHEDLTPMEEAMAYKRLIDMGQTQEQIASSIGQNRSHVKDRLALCRLFATPVAAAIDSGSITPSHGNSIAAVPSATLRLELLDKVLHPPDSSAPPWNRDALEEHIKLDYVVDLRTATFDKEDVDLVAPEYEEGHEGDNTYRMWGGACDDCPFNVAPEGAHKKSSARMCTNPECFRAKEAAEYERWRAEVGGQRPGVGALSHAENAALWNDSGTALAHYSSYIELEELPAQSELKSGAGLGDIWRKLIKGQQVPIVLGRDSNGKVHELALHELAKKAAHLNGHLIFRDSERQSRTDGERSSTADRPAPKSDEDLGAETLAKKKERQTAAATFNAEIAAIVLAVEAKGVRGGHVNVPMEFWDAAILTLFDVLSECRGLGELVARRSGGAGPADPESIVRSLKKMSLRGRLGLLAECLVRVSGKSEPLAKVFGVRLRKLRRVGA